MPKKLVEPKQSYSVSAKAVFGGETGENFLPTVTITVFFWEVISVGIFGRQEMISNLAQYLSEYVLAPYKVFFNVFHVR